MKTSVSKEKVVQFSNFAIEYIYKNEKVCKPLFVCSYGAQVESLKQKSGYNLVTPSLKVA